MSTRAARRRLHRSAEVKPHLQHPGGGGRGGGSKPFGFKEKIKKMEFSKINGEPLASGLGTRTSTSVEVGGVKDSLQNFVLLFCPEKTTQSGNCSKTPFQSLYWHECVTEFWSGADPDPPVQYSSRGGSSVPPSNHRTSLRRTVDALPHHGRSDQINTYAHISIYLYICFFLPSQRRRDPGLVGAAALPGAELATRHVQPPPGCLLADLGSLGGRPARPRVQRYLRADHATVPSVNHRGPPPHGAQWAAGGPRPESEVQSTA